MSKALVMTLGVGEGVWHGLAYSIRQMRPSLVLFLASKVSVEKTFVKLRDALKDSGVNLVEGTDTGKDGAIAYVLEIYDEINDVVKLIMNYRNSIMEHLINRGFHPSQIDADITSGTKPMSAALLAVALELELNSVIYVKGQRGEMGRVISGTEELMTISPQELRFDRKLCEVLQLFNMNFLGPALQLVSDMRSQYRDPEKQKELEFLYDLIEGFYAWDRFDYSKALESLAKARRNGKWAERYGVKEQLLESLEILERMRENSYCEERVLDIFFNGVRRLKMGFYDDAAARFYRLLEYLAQFELYTKFGLETGEIDLEKLRKLGVLEKWFEVRENKNAEQVGLAPAYELLKLLGNPVGELLSDEVKEFLNTRNYSILAHGFEPVDRDRAEKFYSYLEEKVLPKFIENFESKKTLFEFPKIRRNGNGRARC